jgi:ATP synthase I subunit
MNTLPEDQPVENYPDPLPANPEAEAFFAGAYRRMERIVLVLAGAFALLVAIFAEGKTAGTFLVGSLAGLLNFIWLKKSASGIVDRMVDGHRVSRVRTAFFLLRYAAMLLVAYAILRGSTRNVLCFCAGLTLPVVAATLEGAYETYVVARRGY